MKYYLEVTHLPTGTVWATEPKVHNDITEVEGFCITISEGECSYLMLDCKWGKSVYLNKSTLKDCTVALISVEEENS